MYLPPAHRLTNNIGKKRDGKNSFSFDGELQALILGQDSSEKQKKECSWNSNFDGSTLLVILTLTDQVERKKGGGLKVNDCAGRGFDCKGRTPLLIQLIFLDFDFRFISTVDISRF